MPAFAAVSAALTLFFLLLLLERLLLQQLRKCFSLVIHVNGTRGKSTVTRMIHALLRQQGMEVFAKTTGSAPRFLLPNGTEKTIKRLGPANIREQRNIMLLSAIMRKEKNTALVFECNAIEKELQSISIKWLKPDINIITNVREDHRAELGNAENAASIFAGAINSNSVLITGDKKFIDLWEKTAEEKELKLFCNKDDDVLSRPSGQAFPENIYCLLSIAEYLGIEKEEALKSIEEHSKDEGAYREYSWELSRKNPAQIIFADARAANDTESTLLLLKSAYKKTIEEKSIKRILLLINRKDRPDRTMDFMQLLIKLSQKEEDIIHFDDILVLGHNPIFFNKKLKTNGINYKTVKNIKMLNTILEKTQEKNILIFAMGNYGGHGKEVSRWLKENYES